VALEGWRIATRFMTPVLLLSDGYVGNGAEPWRIPELAKLPRISVEHPGPRRDGEPFRAYERNERLARPWALPGTEGLMHRIGGLEKEDGSGNVSYDPENHQHMTNVRARKVEKLAQEIPSQEAAGPESGELLVLSWGGVFGACATAVEHCRSVGGSVAHAHLRYLNPFPANLADLLNRYEKVLIPELNTGQLRSLVQAKFLRPTFGLNKVEGRPFTVGEIVKGIERLLDEKPA
jgi:2-oxoglutarate ferredoxin oxidoreductase subunit alpha